MNNIQYSYENLIKSKHFRDNVWAAKIALNPNEKYSLEEAKEIVDAFLRRKVEK